MGMAYQLRRNIAPPTKPGAHFMAKKYPTIEADENENPEIKLQEITIQGISFTIPAPYFAGYVVTAAEAAALNQTYAENLRNNFAKSVKAAAEADAQVDVETLQAQLTEYAATYEFQGRRRSVATPVDPVAREAYKIAKQAVVEALQKRSIKVKDLPEGKLDALIAGLIEKNPDITEEARRRVAVTTEATSDLFDSILDAA
jgi:hypothetical protein